MRVLRQFFAALIFLTRIPVPIRILARLGSSVWSFPIIGALIGGAVAGVVWLAEFIHLPGLLMVLVALGVGIVLTGAMHEDGLADFCDGLGVYDKDKALQAMRDSRIGSFGAIGLLFSLLWHYGALVHLEVGGHVMLSVFLMHVGGRGLIAPLLLVRRVRRSGQAFSAGRAGIRGVIFALLLTVAVFLYVLPLKIALLALLFGGLAVLGVAYIALRRFGGVTGDVYGAAEQAAEMAILAVLATLLPIFGL